MTERTILVGELFDADAVAELVQRANMYKGRILLAVDEKTANVKSIMGVISLGLDKGSRAVISAEGDDADAAVRDLGDFLGVAV